VIPRKLVSLAVWGVASSFAAMRAQSPPGDWQNRLREAIRRAVAENPDVTSMEARIQASRRRVPQATALPDPELEVGIRDIPIAHPSLTRDEMTMEMIQVRQRFPGAGKLRAEERSAEADLRAARAEHLRHVVEIAADVADSFFHLAELDRRIGLFEDTRARLSDAVVSARERYRVGKGAQADVLRADLEKTALDDRLATLQSARRSEAGRFNALQNLAAGSPVPKLEVPPDVESQIAARTLPTAEALVGEAERESPAVAVASARIAAAQEQLEKARLEKRPDWMLAGYWGRRESFEDMAGLSVSFNLPWVHPKRLSERRAEREAELEAARADLSAVRNALRRDVDQAYAELERNREQVRLYRDAILPQARMNYRAAREAYAVGGIDFLTYARAATDLDAYEGESAERETGVARALAMLQKASGLPLIAGTRTPEDTHHEN
jgi:cobalt-zinc-cadmium efflux system outer membrane protein